MSRLGSTIVLLVTSLAVNVTGSLARADSPPMPHSYRKVTPGGEYVFVMLDPLRIESDVPRNETTNAGVREIHPTYTRSGLYRNDGSTEPLWTVDRYTHQHDVAIASDGVHLVCLTTWVKSPDANAIEFFASGKPLRSYTYRELVGDVSDRTYSGYLTATISPGRQLDEAKQEFSLDVGGDRFVFDIRTGEMVSEPRIRWLLRWGWWAGLGVVVLAVAWVAVRWRFLHRKARQS